MTHTPRMLLAALTVLSVLEVATALADDAPKATPIPTP